MQLGCRTDPEKAMTFTGDRFLYSIGISLLKVKDCFQDNSHKDILFSRHMQTFSRLFFHYNDVCGHMFMQNLFLTK